MDLPEITDSTFPPFLVLPAAMRWALSKKDARNYDLIRPADTTPVLHLVRVLMAAGSWRKWLP
jgi:hypothetical protein